MEFFFWKYYFGHATFSCSSTRFLNFSFSSRKSQSQQKIETKITYSTVQFRSKNVTNNKLNMGPFKKYVTCITAFLLHSILSHFVNFFLSVPLRYSLNFTKKLKNERKEDFFAYNVSASMYRVMSKEAENHIFRSNCIFRQPCEYKQPTLAK